MTAELTALLHGFYTLMLAQAIIVHALDRHESCRRNAAVVASLSVPVLATATVKADEWLMLLLQLLQTSSVTATILGGLYMLAFWLKTANDKSFQDTDYSHADDMGQKTESVDSMNQYHHPLI
ncbi:MAG: hypothetical protein QXH35_08790 [Nitrososphaerota archaeon]